MTSLPLNSTLPPSLFNQKQKSWSRRRGGRKRGRERKKKKRPRDPAARQRRSSARRPKKVIRSRSKRAERHRPSSNYMPRERPAMGSEEPARLEVGG